MRVLAASRWASSLPPAVTISRSSTAPTASAGPGGTTPSRARPATSRPICTRTRSRSTRAGARPTPNQPEILAYLEKVALDYGLGPHLRPNTAITSAALVGFRPALDAEHRRRSRARIRCGSQCGRDARCAEHSRHPRREAVPRPPIPFGPLGSQQVDGGGAGRVHRHGRQRGAIRSRDRAGDGASHGVSADPDLDRAALRFPVHPRAARRVRTRPERRRRSCATRPSMPTSQPVSTSTPRRPAKQPNSPAATSCARSPTPSYAQS